MRFVDGKKAIAHLLWMTQHMPNKSDNPYKWNRWFGFIQGCVFSLGLFTIKQMKDMNKRNLNSALWHIDRRIVQASNSLGGVSLKRWEDGV